jgi:hypothetical protein
MTRSLAVAMIVTATVGATTAVATAVAAVAATADPHLQAGAEVRVALA